MDNYQRGMGRSRAAVQAIATTVFTWFEWAIVVGAVRFAWLQTGDVIVLNAMLLLIVLLGLHILYGLWPIQYEVELRLPKLWMRLLLMPLWVAIAAFFARFVVTVADVIAALAVS